MASNPKAVRLGAFPPRKVTATTPTVTHTWIIAMLVVCALAAGLRIASARGELWLDEAWSVVLVGEQVKSPADVVLRLHHDNNHMLNSWVAYALGPQAADWQYRAPAVVAGIAGVLFAAWAQRNLGPPTSLAAATFVGLSYLLVHYSSEARGYAYLTSLMLLAYGALQRAEESEWLGWEMLISASTVLGFLAHPLFVTMYGAIQVWTWLPVGRQIRAGEIRKVAVAALFRTLLPGLFFAWLYWINLRQMQIGGGDAQPYAEVIVQTLSLACGGSFSPPVSYLAAALSTILTIVALWYVFRESPRRAYFYLAVIVVLPVGLLLVAPRSDIYPRYFLGSVIFLYLLWSEFLGGIFPGRRGGRVAYGVVLVAFAAANLVHIGQLISIGRSHYREALELVARQSTAADVNFVADHNFRHMLMLSYLSSRSIIDKRLIFDPQDPQAISKAEWLLTHSLDPNFQPPATLWVNGVYDFGLVRSYPYAGLSGWKLNVYRKGAAANQPAVEGRP